MPSKEIAELPAFAEAIPAVRRRSPGLDPGNAPIALVSRADAAKPVVGVPARRPEMAPQPLEKARLRPGYGMVSEAATRKMSGLRVRPGPPCRIPTGRIRAQNSGGASPPGHRYRFTRFSKNSCRPERGFGSIVSSATRLAIDSRPAPGFSMACAFGSLQPA